MRGRGRYLGRQVVKVRADFDINGKPIPQKFKYTNGEREISVI